jgi:hypothetical protein
MRVRDDDISNRLSLKVINPKSKTSRIDRNPIVKHETCEMLPFRSRACLIERAREKLYFHELKIKSESEKQKR